MNSPTWNDENVVVLRSLWGTQPVRDIAKRLHMTRNQVIGKAYRLKLKRLPTAGPKWAEEEIATLLRSYARAEPIKNLAARLGRRSMSAIWHKAADLGVAGNRPGPRS